MHGMCQASGWIHAGHVSGLRVDPCMTCARVDPWTACARVDPRGACVRVDPCMACVRPQGGSMRGMCQASGWIHA